MTVCVQTSVSSCYSWWFDALNSSQRILFFFLSWQLFIQIYQQIQMFLWTVFQCRALCYRMACIKNQKDLLPSISIIFADLDYLLSVSVIADLEHLCIPCLVYKEARVQSLLCKKPNSMTYCLNGHVVLIHEKAASEKIYLETVYVQWEIYPKLFYQCCLYQLSTFIHGQCKNIQCWIVLCLLPSSHISFMFFSIPSIPRVMCKVRRDSAKAFHWQKSF